MRTQDINNREAEMSFSKILVTVPASGGEGRWASVRQVRPARCKAARGQAAVFSEVSVATLSVHSPLRDTCRTVCTGLAEMGKVTRHSPV